jgi:3-hydroxyacyl-CoA dehydrogenase
MRVRPRSGAVLGAGTMGAQIAAHLANAGLPVILCDVTRDAAAAGIARLAATKPDPLFTPDLAALLTPAGFDDLALAARADWIVEAVVEDLEVKRDLLARLEPHLKPDTIVSSNTSGIPLGAIARGRSAGFGRRWLGTHFFNPPRYLPLVELVPTPETDADLVAGLAAYLGARLGKSVVVARDTPGFIANRIGIYGAVRALELVASGRFTVEEVDAATGPALGRPKSATFRTIDLAGLDILVRVADDLRDRLSGRRDAEAFAVPRVIRQMVDRQLLGAKTSAGFYKRVPGEGASDFRVLDLDSLADFNEPPRYRPQAPVRPPPADGPPADRIRRLFTAPDRTGELIRATLGRTLVYAAEVTSEIASSPDDIDRAMRWGFGWAIGPFETWDAIGPDVVCASMGLERPPAAVRELGERGRTRFRDEPLKPTDAGALVLTSARQRGAVVRSNAGASLLDLGDGVLALELHSKMNAIGGDALEMLQAGLELAAASYEALVVGAEGELFSAGANLMLLLLEAQEGNWDEVDLMVRSFQRATTAIKTSPVPVVVAVAGLALGGGCEIALHADRVQAAAEAYMGLVEVGVGLIPAAGGTKEMLLRALDAAGETDALPHVRAAFETMALARVSTSAAHARSLGYLRDVDGVTMHRDRVVGDAAATARHRARHGYRPALVRTAIPVGGADTLALLSLGVHLAHRAGRITDHDARIGRALARVLAGGDLPHRATVSESHLLDLEREAFLSLCGEPRTLERIAHTLKTGKPLRN